jgi:hypothetical protein
MKVRKKYKILVSNRLPNDCIYSVEIGTELEDDDVDPDELFKKAKQLTLKDLKADKFAIQALARIKDGFKIAKRLENSEKDFEEYE